MPDILTLKLHDKFNIFELHKDGNHYSFYHFTVPRIALGPLPAPTNIV